MRQPASVSPNVRHATVSQFRQSEKSSCTETRVKPRAHRTWRRWQGSLPDGKWCLFSPPLALKGDEGYLYGPRVTPGGATVPLETTARSLSSRWLFARCGGKGGRRRRRRTRKDRKKHRKKERKKQRKKKKRTIEKKERKERNKDRKKERKKERKKRKRERKRERKKQTNKERKKERKKKRKKERKKERKER